MQRKFTPKQAGAFWILKALEGKELGMLALHWLEERDSPSLRQLAGEKDTSLTEHSDVFEKVLKELQVDLSSKNAACAIVAASFAEQILSGELSPYEGAVQICRIISPHYSGNLDSLLTFIGAASELGELQGTTSREELQGQIEQSVLRAARELVDNKSEQLSRLNK
jgi:hypothetical protein